jgi:type IV pilus assembly protein PilW
VYAGAGANGSDVLALATGSSGRGESPLKVLGLSATGTSVRVPVTLGLRGGDLLMVVQDDGTCLMQQVANGFVGKDDQQLNFGGDYATSETAGVKLETAGAPNAAVLTPLGNVAGNRPNISFIGVGANDVLMSYDVLRLDGTDAAVPIADGVADLRMLYGIDTNNDGVIDSWVSPATAPWDAVSLNKGTVAARDQIVQILAVRVGLMLHNASPERSKVTAAKLSLFADLPELTYTRDLSDDEQKLRWRSLDFTVPLRNVILKAP